MGIDWLLIFPEINTAGNRQRLNLPFKANLTGVKSPMHMGSSP